MVARPDDRVLQRPWDPPGRIVRYSSHSLPDVRYLPGANTRPDDQEIPSEDAFNHGVDLYNLACWWEAHEVWEDVWIAQRPQSLERLAMELLINAANLNLKILLGQPGAANRLSDNLAERYDEWLRRGGGVTFCIDIPVWYSQYRSYVKTTLQAAKLLHSIETFPFLFIDLPDK